MMTGATIDHVHGIYLQVNFTINDVDWGSSDASKTTLASGLSNGHIGIWDVSKDGKQGEAPVFRGSNSFYPWILAFFIFPLHTFRVC